MVEESDIRWQYRFVKFNKVLKQLQRFVLKAEFTEIEEQGIIKSFEYTFDFSLKTLQDLLEVKYFQNNLDPKSVIEMSFQRDYISDKEGWLKMVESRNFTTFTYDEQNAEELVEDIKDTYINLFGELKAKLEKEKHRE